MGKGSYDGIEDRPANIFELNAINEFIHNKERTSILENLGYEVCKIDGDWFYRWNGSDNKWTPMNHKK